MGGKAALASCKRCENIRPIRKGSGLCYTCHWHVIVLPRIEVSEPKLPDQIIECRDENQARLREAVQVAVKELYDSWFVNDTPRALERQEIAAWDLIEKIEDLLGKE